MNNKLYSLVLFCLLSLVSFSQNSIQGTVEADGVGIGFATVKIKNSNTGVFADENGVFTISDAPSPPFSMVASFIGYKPKTIEVNTMHDPIIFTLEPSENSIQEVVVTGTMQETYIKDSPVKVNVVTSKRVETYLPTAGTSIIENVSLVNGVQEVVACGVCFTNQISINGLPGQYTAVLMDGTPIYGNLASVYGLNGTPNQIIDRFEIIKGPSSTLYGSEAVAGVINIITKDPEWEPTLAVDIMGNSNLDSYGNISATPRIGNSHGFLGVNYAYQNSFQDNNEDGIGDNINLDRLSIFSKWNLARKLNRKFTVSAKYYYEDRRNGVQNFIDNLNTNSLRGDEYIYGESIFTKRVELFGTYEIPTKEHLLLDFSVSDHSQDSFYGSDSYMADQQIAFGNLVWKKDLSSHQLTGGATFRYNAYDDNTIATQEIINEESKNAPSNQFITGAFLQDEWLTSDQLTTLAGARIDHYDKHGVIFAPRLSLKYDFADFTSMRANFGTGFRIVNLFTEDHAFISGQREVEILENLSPEESYNASFNINHEYSSNFGTGSLELDSYYTYFTNKIIPNYDVANKIIYENTNGFAVTKGIGGNISHNFNIPLGFNVGLNWQNATETVDNVKSEIEFSPRFSSVATVNYLLEEPTITLGYTANFTGRMALPEVFDLDENGNPLREPRPTVSRPFSIHTLQGEKKMNNGMRVYIGIQNLTNFTQNESPLVGFNDPNSPVGFSQYFDTSYAYAPNQGREAYLGFKWNLN